MVDVVLEVLEVGPYSLVVCKVSGKYALCYHDPSYPKNGTTLKYLWKDGVFRSVAGTSTDIWGGWFDSMEDVLATLKVVS